jgi:diguanylate cyclase (GGDEF)-like protein
MAEQIRSTLAAIAVPHAASPVCGYVTMSVGVAWKAPQKQDGPDAGALIEEADRNLYLAKHRGRNRVSPQAKARTKS